MSQRSGRAGGSHRALSRDSGHSREEMQMIKTIVIGAGVMGASVAYRLAQAGAAVTVLEAARIGGGTSGISFAWTNAHKKPPKPYHDLNVAGMKAHAALAASLAPRHGG